MKIGVTAAITQSGATGIQGLDLHVFTMEPGDTILGVTTYRNSVFTNGGSVRVRCQCNESGCTAGRWYAGEINLVARNRSQLDRSVKLARKIVPEDVFGCEDATPMIRNALGAGILVEPDARFGMNYVPEHELPELKHVRAWIDDKKSGTGCTVRAYTQHPEPSEDCIRDVIKRAMCEHGYADQLVRWARDGMPYREVGHAREIALVRSADSILKYPAELAELAELSREEQEHQTAS